MKNESIILAGGCFWGVEELFRKVEGVSKTEVGYTGGATENPTYETIKTGSTGHAEAIKIDFNPDIVSLESLLIDHFFRLHDPTTKNRQGNDVGSQYRSAIFYANEEQKSVSEEVISRLQSNNIFPSPIVTEVVPESTFYSAEDYHQDYLQKNPGGYTCHFYR